MLAEQSADSCAGKHIPARASPDEFLGQTTLRTDLGKSPQEGRRQRHFRLVRERNEELDLERRDTSGRHVRTRRFSSPGSS